MRREEEERIMKSRYNPRYKELILLSKRGMPAIFKGRKFGEN